MSTRPMHLMLHQHRALRDGPRVLMLGAVHGNETCCAVALQRLDTELCRGQHTLMCGSLTLLPITNQRRGVTRTMKAMIKRRSAIEPTIRHTKSDGRLDRNPLNGELGDALHAVL